MATREIVVTEYVCDKCGHAWVGRPPQKKRLPSLCPQCQTGLWNYLAEETEE